MPTSAPTQLRRTSRLSSHAPMAIADRAMPHRATCPKAASSLNQPWAKASAASVVAAPGASPPGAPAAGSSPAGAVLATVAPGTLLATVAPVDPAGAVAGTDSAGDADTVG